MACTDLGYTIETMIAFLRTATYPLELLALLQERGRCKSLPRLVQKLEPQRLEMLPKVEENYRLLLIERARQRDAAEKARREAIQEKLRRLGRCPMSFEWILIGNGRYRCAGGAHTVSESELNYE